MNSPQTVALVTGATRGIRLETVRQLAQRGATVLPAGRDPQRAEAAAAALRADGLRVEAIDLDVTHPASIHRATEVIRSRFGKLDIRAARLTGLLDRRLPQQSRAVAGQATVAVQLAESQQ